MTNNKIEELITKYNLKIAYRGNTKGIQSVIKLEEKDKILIKNNKDHILKYLEQKKKECDEKKHNEYLIKRAKELQQQYPNKFEQAKIDGKDILLKTWEEPCNCPEEECNLDIIYLYVTPQQTIYSKRQHTW